MKFKNTVWNLNMTSNIWNLNLAKWSVLCQVSRNKSWDEGSCARCLFRRRCTQKMIWKWRKQGRPGQKPSREGLQQLPAHLQGLSEWKWCLSYPDLKRGGLLLAFILPCPSVMGLGPPYTMEISRHFERPAQVGEDSPAINCGKPREGQADTANRYPKVCEESHPYPLQGSRL